MNVRAIGHIKYDKHLTVPVQLCGHINPSLLFYCGRCIFTLVIFWGIGLSSDRKILIVLDVGGRSMMLNLSQELNWSFSSISLNIIEQVGLGLALGGSIREISGAS